jgi:flagellar biogenesis protein FliO
MSLVDTAFYVPKQPKGSAFWKLLLMIVLILLVLQRVCHAEGTNGVALAVAQPLPDASFSVLRVFGSLVLVIALFLCGVWLFRNWQRLATRNGLSPRLNILESKSMGHRHSIFVVGYDDQRFLVSSSPSGVQMLTPLPDAEPGEATETRPMPNFAAALQKVLAGK